jgi:hypothetical protein
MSAARHSHTIIPAPTRIVRIRPEERRVITDTVVDIAHTVASAGAVVIFLAGLILTNL